MENGRNAPLVLEQLQNWFAEIITKPVDIDSKINSIAPSGEPIEIEAKKYVVPSPTLLPYERMQIYNQQYWWRLLSVMHDSYPFVVRLFGYHDFNETLAVPYLVKYPPIHWSLSTLGDRFTRWAEEEYHFEDREFVLDAIRIDDAFLNCFYASKVPSLADYKQYNPLDLLEETLFLQDFVYFFSMRYDLFSFRETMLKEEPDHWETHDFPKLEKEKSYHFLLYRDRNNDMIWKEIDLTEMILLKCFKKGSSIVNALECAELQNEEHYHKAEKHLGEWVQSWVIKGLLRK